MKKIVALVVSVLICFSITISCFADSSNTIIDPTTSDVCDKIIKNFSEEISDIPFTDDGVIYVILHHNISDVNKVYDKEYFPELNIESIEDWSCTSKGKTKDDYGSEFRNILKIVLKNKTRSNVIDAINLLQKRAEEDIYWAQPSYKIDYMDVIDENLTSSVGYALEQSDYYDLINLPQAWGINPGVTTGSDNVKVAVIDRGICEHPVLGDNLNMELGYSTQYADPDPYSIPLYSVQDSDGNTELIYNYHGVACGSIIGAQGNDDYPITGVCWDVSIVPVKFYYGMSQYEEMFNYFDEHDILIANMSNYDPNYGDSYYEVVTQFINNYRGLLVCSAGNSGKNTDKYQHYPSALDCDNIIAVGASTNNDTVAGFSNYGNNTVDLFAPGENIYMAQVKLNEVTSETELTVGTSEGTSYAAPMVAGVAALIQNTNPALTNLQIKAILMNTSDRIDALIGKCVSGGRLNAYEAVRIAHSLSTDALREELSEADINKSEYLFISDIPTIENADSETVLDTANETFIIDKCVSSNESVTLPQTFRGKDVTRINSYAFDANNVTTSVVVPSTVEPYPRAFNNSDTLNTVSFADETTTIPSGTFNSCYNIKNIYIPGTVVSFGAGSLNDAIIFISPENPEDDEPDNDLYNFFQTSGYSVCTVLGNTILSYSEGNSNTLRDVFIPSYINGIKITTIGGYAFDNADDVVSVEIPNTVTTIGYRAFRNCDQLKAVFIPNSVTSISNSMNSTIVEGSTNAVIYCPYGNYPYVYSLSTNATFVYMSIDYNTNTVSVAGIKEGAEGGTELHIPETFMGYDVTSVAAYAFDDGVDVEYNITKIFLPESIVSIGSEAFFSCANLTDIYIPSTQTTLESSCFSPFITSGFTIHCPVPSPAFIYATTYNYSYMAI